MSNAHAGKEFEQYAKNFFRLTGLNLQENFPLSIGIEERKKLHRFDLGCEAEKVIIECKSHTWTEGGKVPSAKLTVWNEAMYYFYISPKDYRKIMFVLRDIHPKNNETLANYYIRTYRHLIPSDVEFWEYDLLTKTASKLDWNV